MLDDKEITLSANDLIELVSVIFRMSYSMSINQRNGSITFDEKLRQRIGELVPDVRRPILYTLIDEYQVRLYDATEDETDYE